MTSRAWPSPRSRRWAKFLASDDKVLVCTHATFRFCGGGTGHPGLRQPLIAIDEFHHVSSNPDNKLGSQLGAFIARDKVHLVAMTGSYFRGDSEAVLAPADEARFETVTYTYYEQLNGYQLAEVAGHRLLFLHRPLRRCGGQGAGPGAEDHRPHSQRQLAREPERQGARGQRIMHALGEWKGIDEAPAST
jgi:hypothetical protein